MVIKEIHLQLCVSFTSGSRSHFNSTRGEKRTHDTDPSPGLVDPVANGDDVDTHLLVDKIKRKKKKRKKK